MSFVGSSTSVWNAKESSVFQRAVQRGMPVGYVSEDDVVDLGAVIHNVRRLETSFIQPSDPQKSHLRQSGTHLKESSSQRQLAASSIDLEISFGFTVLSPYTV